MQKIISKIRGSAEQQGIKSIEHNSCLRKERVLRDHLEDSLRFAEIHKRCLEIQCVSFILPPMDSTAGKVLKHAACEVERLFRTHEPLIFKLGYTHDPAFRWSNTIYGYKHDRDSWTNMVVLFVSREPCGPAMLEACLIDKYGSRLVAYIYIYIYIYMYVCVTSRDFFFLILLSKIQIPIEVDRVAEISKLVETRCKIPRSTQKIAS